MTQFDQREEGFERAYIHDEELRFQVRVRGLRHLGLWAAETLGLAADAARAYANGLVERQMQGADEAALIGVVAKDLPAVSEHRIRRRLAECEAEAQGELQSGR